MHTLYHHCMHGHEEYEVRMNEPSQPARLLLPALDCWLGAKPLPARYCEEGIRIIIIIIIISLERNNNNKRQSVSTHQDLGNPGTIIRNLHGCMRRTCS